MYNLATRTYIHDFYYYRHKEMEYVFIPDYDALDVERRVIDEYNAFDTSILQRTSPPADRIPALERSQNLLNDTYAEPRQVQQTPRQQNLELKIPRMILQVVKDKNSLVESLSSSIKENMPTWNYVMLTEIDADKYVQQMHPDFLSTYSNYKYWEQKRNAVIFLWLYKNGGLYIDINYRMMSNLELKLPLDAELYLMQSPDVETYYTTSLLGGMPQHHLWKACIEEMRTLARSPPKWTISKDLYISATTGTIMFSSMISKVNTPYYVLPVSGVAPRGVCGNKTEREAGVLYQTYSCDDPQGMEQWIYSMYVCNPYWFYIIIILLVLLLIWIVIKCINYFSRPKTKVVV